MFTDRFIKVPVDLYERKDADIVGYNNTTKCGRVYMRINPFEISHYRPSEGNDTDEMVSTLIYMKGGDSMHISMKTEQFEKLLNNAALNT